MRHAAIYSIVLPLLVLLTGCAGGDGDPAEGASAAASQTALKPIVVYSARKEHLIRPLFERYTELTGVPIDFITDSAGPLVARLSAEAERSPDRKSTRLNSSHSQQSRMPSSA